MFTVSPQYPVSTSTSQLRRFEWAGVRSGRSSNPVETTTLDRLRNEPTTAESLLADDFQSHVQQLALQDPVAFRSALQAGFASKASPAAIDQLLDLALSGELPMPANLRLVPPGALGGGATGAYRADEGGTVYLDRALQGDPVRRRAAFTAQLGQHIDRLLGSSDATGNAGAAFAMTLDRGALPAGTPAASGSDNAPDQASLEARSMPVETQTPASTPYLVRQGDTLGKIARDNGTSVQALIDANGISNPDLILTGQTLNIPARPPAGVDSVGNSAANAPASAPAPAVAGATGSGADFDARVRSALEAVPDSVRQANPNVEQHVRRILTATEAQNLTPAQTAYVLATATHESNLGLHMEEFASGRAYEGRADLGNTQPGDGVRYKGRGYVQLTGRANYQHWSNRLGVDLVGNPELASRPDIAARILVGGMVDGTFTGRALGDYINSSGTDFRGARRTVNGLDRADRIAGQAQQYEQALLSVPAQAASQPVTSTGANDTAVQVGAEGSNASLWAKSTADIDNLSPRITSRFDDIVAAWAAKGGPTPVITSGNDSRHSTGSLHYQNLAIDLRANNISDSDAQAIADDLQSRLGSDYDVIFEHFPGNTSNDHIHLEYDPD